jgi:hypothetical protein
MSTPAGISLYRRHASARRRSFGGLCGARSLLLAAACGAVFISGCNLNNSGLSSKLPPAGGGGALSFESVAMPDAIAGRTYSKVAVTSAETEAQTLYPVSPAIASGTPPLATCIVTAGALPPGMNSALTIDPTGAGCVISGTPTSAAAGNTYQFTIQALDSNSPPRAASQAFSLKVRPEFTLTAPPAETGTTFLPGVKGRPYGEVSNTASAILTTLGTAGNAPIATGGCVVTATPSNPGLAGTISGGTSCLITASSLTATGTFSLSASVKDSPINDPETLLPAVPANTVTIPALTNASLTIDSPLVLVPPAGLANAVDARAYGTTSNCNGQPCVPATFTVSGGLGGYLANATVTSAPGTWTCPLTGSSYNCSTTSVSTAGPYPAASSVSVSASDTANAVTPAATAVTDPGSASSASLSVVAPLTVTAPASFAAAVSGRSYGSSATGCSPTPQCSPLQYTVSGGLGSYSANATIVSAPGTWTCPLSGTTYSCTSSSVTSAGPFPATPNVSITASDAANVSAPNGTSNTSTVALTVDGPLTLTAPTSPATAANGRPYGANATVTNPAACGAGGTSACAPAAFTITGGLGGYSTPATTSSAPGTWSCPLSAATYACATSSVSATGPFPATPSLSLNAVTDTANASTPSGTSNTATVNLTVGGTLTLTAPTGLATAVDLRGYGSNAGVTNNTCGPTKNASCTAAVFSASGGLGVYSATPNIVTAPGTWSCLVAGANYSCATTSVSAASPYPATPALSLSISDVPNASSPSATSNTASATLTVNAPMTVGAPATVNAAVSGRSYGTAGNCTGGACIGITYTVSGGLGNYGPGTLTAGGNTFTCTGTGPYVCNDTDVTGPGAPTLTMSIPETGNNSAPAATATDTTRTLTVGSPITVTSSQTGTWSVAVQGRTYGEGSTPNNFSASGGISPYVSFTPSNFPAGFTCNQSGATANCNSADVTGGPGTFSPRVTVVDTGNASTPPATPASDPGSVLTDTNALVVNGPLAISAITLPNGLVGYPYPNPAIPNSTMLSTTGGLSGNTWVAPGGTAVGACPSSPTGAFPPGTFALNSSSTTAEIAGTPSTGSTSAGQYAFQVCVTDTANAMTPQGFAVPNTPGDDLIIDVLNPLAYITDPTSDTVDVFNTATHVDALLPPLTGSAPYATAFSTSGRYAYVTLSNTGQLAIYDTITNAQTASPASPLALTGCTAPNGIATAPANHGNPSLVFIACNGSGNVAVFNTSTFAVTTIATDSAASEPESVAVSADGSRAYVTLSGENKLFTIDNSGATPVALSGTGITNPYPLPTTKGTIPIGIGVAPCSGCTTSTAFAYITQQNTSGSPDGILILNVTSDLYSTVSDTQTSAVATAIPNFVAATPDGKSVYVTLTGADQFAVYSNTSATPGQIAGSPFTLATASADPEGVILPVVAPATPPATTLYFGFIVQNATNNLAVIDNASPPVADAISPVTLSGTAPLAIASIPAPQ